jgi:hypothetical protein
VNEREPEKDLTGDEVVYLLAWGLHDLVVTEDGFTVETRISSSRSDASVSEPPKDLGRGGEPNG